MDYLFVYGSLLLSDNEYGKYLSMNSRPIKTGKFRGKLFDLGEYPGAVYLPQAFSYVFGTIVSLKNPEEALNVIDDYEGFGIEQNQPNEFVRSKLTVSTDSETISCWVYLYNLATSNLPEIKSGDYLKFCEGNQ